MLVVLEDEMEIKYSLAELDEQRVYLLVYIGGMQSQIKKKKRFETKYRRKRRYAINGPK